MTYSVEVFWKDSARPPSKLTCDSVKYDETIVEFRTQRQDQFALFVATLHSVEHFELKPLP